MGISGAVPITLRDTLRSNLFCHSLASMISIFDDATTKHDIAANKCTSAILHLYLDVLFVKYCYYEYNQYDIVGSDSNNLKTAMDNLHDKVEKLANATCSRAVLLQLPELARQKHAIYPCPIGFVTQVCSVTDSIGSCLE